MSEEAERMKRLVEFKKKLEIKIEQMSSDLKDSQTMLDIVTSFLIEKGFRRLEVKKEPTTTETLPPAGRLNEGELEPAESQSMEENENATPLQTMAGELLANLYAHGDSLRVVLAEDKNFNINTPPFAQFFVERILQKMQERDSELVRAGQLSPEDVLCYSVVREGDVIREIAVKNVDPDRLKELKSSIRWTLEKMYEKMKGQT